MLTTLLAVLAVLAFLTFVTLLLRARIERSMGIYFGRYKISDEATTASGYPLNKTWLTIAPPHGRFMGSVSVRRHLFYLGRAKR